MTLIDQEDIEKIQLLDDPHSDNDSDSITDSGRVAFATADYDELEIDESETAPLSGKPNDQGESTTACRLPNEGGSIFASFLNMANSIIGAGIIGLPFSFKEAGFCMGIFLLIALTLLVDWTVRLLVYNGKLAGRSTYQDLLAFAFGRQGLIAISIFQFAFGFGGMCAYCVILGDTIPHVIRSLVPNIHEMPIVWIFANRRLCITFFTMVVSYPLSLYRDISKLAKTSGLALIAIVIIIIAVLVEGPKVPPELTGSADQRFVFANNEMFQAIAVISFAFVCHHNSFLIFGSLKQPSLNRFAAVTHWSMAVAFLTCILLAVSGYVVFTDKTAGNILNNFPADNVFINVARLSFGLNMFTTIPLEAFVCREVLETYFWPKSKFRWDRHIIITTVLVLAAMVISLLTCNLGIVLELTGAFSATALAYILPPLCYLKIATGSLFQMSKIPHWACLVFGIAIMLVSTFFSLQKAFFPVYAVTAINEGSSSSSSSAAAICDL